MWEFNGGGKGGAWLKGEGGRWGKGGRGRGIVRNQFTNPKPSKLEVYTKISLPSKSRFSSETKLDIRQSIANNVAST